MALNNHTHVNRPLSIYPVISDPETLEAEQTPEPAIVTTTNTLAESGNRKVREPLPPLRETFAQAFRWYAAPARWFLRKRLLTKLTLAWIAGLAALVGTLEYLEVDPEPEKQATALLALSGGVLLGVYLIKWLISAGDRQFQQSVAERTYADRQLEIQDLRLQESRERKRDALTRKRFDEERHQQWLAERRQQMAEQQQLHQLRIEEIQTRIDRNNNGNHNQK